MLPLFSSYETGDSLLTICGFTRPHIYLSDALGQVAILGKPFDQDRECFVGPRGKGNADTMVDKRLYQLIEFRGG